MGRYLGPKVRLSRRCGVPIADIPKHTGKELQIPGMHGYRGRRMTEYGVRMAEKQKLRFHYNILEKQFRRFMSIAQKTKGNTGDAMIGLLERRLDNVCRRLGVSRTIWGARQLVVHGHVLVNGKKLDRPSYVVNAGDTITFKEKAVKLARESMESIPRPQRGWLARMEPGSAQREDHRDAEAGRCSVRSEHEPDYRILSVIRLDRVHRRDKQREPRESSRGSRSFERAVDGRHATAGAGLDFRHVDRFEHAWRHFHVSRYIDHGSSAWLRRDAACGARWKEARLGPAEG